MVPMPFRHHPATTDDDLININKQRRTAERTGEQIHETTADDEASINSQHRSAERTGGLIHELSKHQSNEHHHHSTTLLPMLREQLHTPDQHHVDPQSRDRPRTTLDRLLGGHQQIIDQLIIGLLPNPAQVPTTSHHDLMKPQLRRR
ncbi:hypothetical protein GE21DRAFT_1332327 [Neurospora crassa]|nr:hypothetical protein GE21DRAFT_1332327 [Neurospora crassa]